MIKASIVLLVAFFITCVLKKRSAAERHLLWVAAIAAAAILPLLGLLVPFWEPAFAQRGDQRASHDRDDVYKPDIDGF